MPFVPPPSSWADTKQKPRQRSQHSSRQLPKPRTSPQPPRPWPDNASELWSYDGTLRRIKPLDVDLDAETQWAIYEACEYDPGLFCLVMAIAEHESGFDPQTVGDNGQSLGMMQINTRWHTGRMEALGVTDLTDPVQCAAVAVDYLRELESRYGFEPLSHELLMGYNFGPGGAKKALAEGKTSSAYSREIMTVYQGYLEELEGAKRQSKRQSTGRGPCLRHWRPCRTA